jgi:50S ribosomal subunit-associated GTPase HflX
MHRHRILKGQIHAVRTVLAEIGAAEVPELLVINKADLAPEAAVEIRRDLSRSVGDQRSHR